MQKTQKRSLNLIDFVVLSVIFFGYATYIAVEAYFTPHNPDSIATDIHSFSDADNTWSIYLEFFLLAIAGIYLIIRRFDFKLLNFSVGKYTLPLMLLLVIVGASVTDLATYGHSFLFPSEVATSPEIPMNEMENYSPPNFLGHISVWLILFALLNGFFEEVFFMGLTFAVKKNQLVYAIVGSIFVRFIFHIYQGIPAAVGIALTGVAFILVRQRVKSIVPFALAHSFFDVFGASLYYWVYMLYYG